jgi:hypothetical protein
VLQGAKKLNRIFFDKLNPLDNPLNFTPVWGGPWADSGINRPYANDDAEVGTAVRHASRRVLPEFVPARMPLLQRASMPLPFIIRSLFLRNDLRLLFTSLPSQ